MSRPRTSHAEVENADHQAIFASRTSGFCDNQIKGSDCPIESLPRIYFLCYFPDSTLPRAYSMNLTNRLSSLTCLLSIRSDSGNRIRQPVVGDGKVP
jgi:hypothetical protein